jgi:hypothetical protein
MLPSHRKKKDSEKGRKHVNRKAYIGSFCAMWNIRRAGMPLYIEDTAYSVLRRILGRIPDKSLKSFPLCYSKSPLQLCLEISIFSNSRNLFQFLQCVFVHCKGERRKTTHPSL